MAETIQDNEQNYYTIAAETGLNPRCFQVQRHSDIINHKIAALLIHISVMTAISMGVYLSSDSNSVIRTLTFLETLGYIILSMFALFGVFVTGPADFLGDEKEKPHGGGAAERPATEKEHTVSTNMAEGHGAADTTVRLDKLPTDRDSERIESDINLFIAVVRHRRITLNRSIKASYVITILLVLTLILKFSWQT